MASLGRKIYWGMLGICGWLAMPAVALAEDDSPPEYVLPYAAVVAGIVLGMMTVLNPSRRRDRAKEELFAEKKKAAKKDA